MGSRTLRYNAGEKIIEAGKVEQRMYIIMEGTVDIVLGTAAAAVTVATLKKGDFFGEISLFNKSARSAHVVAKETVTLAYIDDLQQLKAFLVKNPSFAAKMVHVLAQRLARTDEILLGKVSEVNRLRLIGK